MSRTYRHYHGYRTHDQDEGHYTHKYQWHMCMSGSGKRGEYLVRIRPAITGEACCSIGDQECAESESITHQKIPHHQLAIFHVEWTSSATPPFCIRWYCLCHVLLLVYTKKCF